MSTPQWPSRIVPAQLSFLAIYNPALGGESDESFKEQLVFYFSRSAHESRIAARKQARNDAAGADGVRAEENERLRQIGLAQGMVDFAKTFSSGAPVDSIETEKSRNVLHELEKGWWILASVDLTRLPPLTSSHASHKKSAAAITADDAVPKVEYSSREVSPPALLIQQLLQAHNIFSLHHGPSLDDLFVRLPREKFCMTLDRFWTRFARNWDVLLHGNPAVDIFSGIKLASGGELGFGVGEEDWGSGEREVLEDLIRRTDGLVDLVVSRFGDPGSPQEQKHVAQPDSSNSWIGSGSQPSATDGLIFGGIAAIQRLSLRNISLWMRHIYTYGDQAYGVKDNPLRERRRRRKHYDSELIKAENGHARESAIVSDSHGRNRRRESETHQKDGANGVASSTPADDTRAVDEPDSEILTTRENEGRTLAKIPPPIVPAISPSEQKADSQMDESTNAFGISDTYMKYLTFGLSTLGKQKQSSDMRNSSDTQAAIQPEEESKVTKYPTDAGKDLDNSTARASTNSVPDDKAVMARLARQKRQENRGHFVIGLKGDLLELDELSEDEQDGFSDGSFGDDTDGSRIVLRTLSIAIVPAHIGYQDHSDEYGVPSPLKSDHEFENHAFEHFRRVRVLLYVHRPFIYCFLFENRTSSLQYSGFYKSLHRNLIPIHKPLLSSTSPSKVAQRIAASRESASAEATDTFSIRSSSTKTPSSNNTMPIYDLIYDPRRMTLHTSIPNIPEPGTPAAEGIFTTSTATDGALSSWNRVEALNVHSQILCTLSNIRTKQGEVERTSKTSRGWWIVWLKIPPSPSPPDASKESQRADDSVMPKSSVALSRTSTEKRQEEVEDMHRIAFLVRKASDTPGTPKQTSTGSKAMSSMLEVMSLGMTSREEDNTGGAGAGWGPAALAGGIGIDARAYVEGLLSLNR